jgi:glyoxalase-like protein
MIVMNAAVLFAAAAATAMQPTALRAGLDHILVGIRDLDEGIAAFARLSGVTAVKGGRHPNAGTENALVSLGSGRYLELIAPREDAAASTEIDAMRALEKLTVIGWAVGVSDLASAREALAARGITLDRDAPGSRLTPSGATLEWSTARLSAPAMSAAPFLIQWKAGTPHPSTTSPSGCTLAAMEIHDPAATDLSRTLDALRVSGVTVRRGDSQVRVTLKCDGRSLTLAGR